MSVKVKNKETMKNHSQPNEMISCEINGQKIQVKKGTSVIEAFKRMEQDICHYCWHPGLSVAGVCRLCMVEIEGLNKLQIACNTEVRDGMKISNTSPKVKTAVRWGLEYHLINHPLDCPVCDQAGECELQEQYMKFGSYDSSMAESKVKKRKVLGLGSKIVLDTERCILCSRCVRFTDEVSKTHELGIFNRGDKSEIGVFKDKPLENDYAMNTVDICPVGALTSRDFRFQQRVWYLKTAPSVCIGCSTGCNIDMDYNEEGVWRVRPRLNEKVNGYWMCDKGRGIYRNTKAGIRLGRALQGEQGRWKAMDTYSVLEEVEKLIQDISPVFVLTGQYTNEEYQVLKDYFPENLYYHWINNEKNLDDFDGLLLRGDRNPNTAGLKNVFPEIQPLKNFKPDINQTVFILGPENPDVYPDIKEKTRLFSQCKQLVWMSLVKNDFLPPKEGFFQIPMSSFVEKTGTYTNYQGLKQKIKKIQTLNGQAWSIQDCVLFFKSSSENQELKKSIYEKSEYPYFKQNQFLNYK